jgi:sugar (pentulose or hexulose) kinase
MTEPLWVGVDVGTQSVRVAIVDEDGVVVGSGASPLRSHRAGGRHEQDPGRWWQAFGLASRQAVSSASGRYRPDGIRAVTFCSTSGTFLLADRDGSMTSAPRARTPALMYDDARAAAEAAEVDRAGVDTWRRLGYRMQASWALPKLLWLLRHGPPDLRADARAGRLILLHSADHLAWWLGGARVATDWSHALKTGYDLDRLEWPEATLEALGIPSGMLPAVVRPGTALGTVGAAGAEHTGLPAGTPILAGMTDGCAAQVAANALTPGSWNVSLGTTLVFKGVTSERLVDAAGVVYCHRHPDAGWLPGGASNTGAGAVDRSFAGLDRGRLEVEAAQHEPSSGLSWPLVAGGERFPFVHAGAAAFEIGDFDDDGDRYAAALQGVAFIERLAFAVLGGLGADLSGPVSVTGGGTRSPYWTQLRADILERALVLPRHEGSAVGAAIVAAAGEGPLAPVAARLSGSAGLVEPRADRSGRFGDAYIRFLEALRERGYVDDRLMRLAIADR